MTNPIAENFDGKHGKHFDALIIVSTIALYLHSRSEQNQE